MDTSDLTLLLALTGPDAERARERLNEFLVARKAAEDAAAAAREEQGKAQAILDQARNTLADAQGTQEAAYSHRAATDAREAELGRSNDALVEEKRKFEEVRAAVENDHTRREVAISAREHNADKRETAVEQRERHAAARLQMAEGLHKSLLLKHDRLKQALETNTAPDMVGEGAEGQETPAA